MNQNVWKHRWMTIIMVAGLASVSLAQEMPAAARSGRSGSGGFGFIATLEHRVGLTPEQRDTVRGLLAEQREKSKALREDTDSKIRALLNPDQQKKFDDVLAEQKAKFARSRQQKPS